MRLHKSNTLEYPQFYKSLEDLKIEEEDVHPGISILNFPTAKEGNLLEKYSHIIQNLVSFQAETENITDPQLLSEKIDLAIKRILPAKETCLLFFDESNVSLVPLNERSDSKLIKTMNHYYKEGILDLIFDSRKAVIVPELNTYNSNGSRLNYILFPIFENGKRKGLLSILSSLSKRKITELDKQIASILLNTILSKIDRVRLKVKLTNTFEELQTYQAKLSNDFRLSAIGELTEGVVEDIMSPLQVIMSQVDLLEGSENESKEVKQIKRQINKIHTVVNRLVKFANINHKNINIRPLDINLVVDEYYNLVSSTLQSVNLECVLDFENEVFPILSHPNYIFQLLTNVISLIKNECGKKGGIIIQTRSNSDYILLKVISTASLKPYGGETIPVKQTANLNLRIIENLMHKHEGSLNIESHDESGSSIILKFPFRRKIRE